MAEYRIWKKINDPVVRIIKYWKEYKDKNKLLELADILKDVMQHEYDKIEKKLLEEGYRISLDSDNYNSRRKIKIGSYNYSYFKLEETNLRKRLYACYNSDDLPIQDIKIVKELKEENKKLKEEKKLLLNEIEKLKGLENENIMIKTTNTLISNQLECYKEEVQNNNRTIKVGSKPYNDKGIVGRIFDMYSSGYSLQDIVNTLNGQNIKTKRGKSWYKSTVKYILENKKYIDMEYISKDKYKKVTKLLRENRKMYL